MHRATGRSSLRGSLLAFLVAVGLAVSCGGQVQPSGGSEETVSPPPPASSGSTPGGSSSGGSTPGGRDAAADSTSPSPVASDASASASDASVDSPGASEPCTTPAAPDPITGTYSLPVSGPPSCQALIFELLQPPQCLPLCHAHICCCKVYEDAQSQLMVQCATQPECPAGLGSC